MAGRGRSRGFGLPPAGEARTTEGDSGPTRAPPTLFVVSDPGLLEQAKSRLSIKKARKWRSRSGGKGTRGGVVGSGGFMEQAPLGGTLGAGQPGLSCERWRTGRRS